MWKKWWLLGACSGITRATRQPNKHHKSQQETYKPSTQTQQWAKKVSEEGWVWRRWVKKVTSKDQLQPSTTPRAPSGPERIYWAHWPTGLPGQVLWSEEELAPPSPGPALQVLVLLSIAPIFQLLASIFQLQASIVQHLATNFHVPQFFHRFLIWFGTDCGTIFDSVFMLS